MHYRALAQMMHNAGIEFMHLANELDGQNIGLTADSVAPGSPFPNTPATLAAPIPPAPSAAAPSTPAAPAPAGTRKRRTKAEIAADEAAIAAGYLDAADQLARTSSGATGAGQTATPPANPPAPLAPGGAPVSAGLPPPPPAALTPPPPAAPSLRDNLQAALMAFGQAVESQWPGQGHGNGQMGVIVAKMAVPNIEALPEANVQPWLNWILDVTTQFRADPSKLTALLA
jgi:hypothetical protein